jgi:transcriptional regulator with XRE-family HTH domain
VRNQSPSRKPQLLKTLQDRRNLIGERISEARLHQNPPWSQETLAEKLFEATGFEIDRGTIAKIESQGRGVYDYEVLAFAQTLGVSLDWLFGLKPKRDNKAQ